MILAPSKYRVQVAVETDRAWGRCHVVPAPEYYFVWEEEGPNKRLFCVIPRPKDRMPSYKDMPSHKDRDPTSLEIEDPNPKDMVVEPTAVLFDTGLQIHVVRTLCILESVVVK